MARQARNAWDAPAFMDARFRQQTAGRVAPPKQKGYRTMQAQYGRLVSVQSEGYGLVCLPLLPGETLCNIEVTEWKCGDVAVQPDSATPILNVCVIDSPRDYVAAGTAPAYASAADINAAITNMVEGVNEQGPFEADPATGSQEIAPVTKGIELLWAEWRLTRSQNISLSWNGVGTTLENRSVDTYVKRYEKNMFIRKPSALIYGVWTPNIAAQTVFGMATAASQLTEVRWHELLTNAYDDLDDTDMQKMHEMLYGGDSYVEADTLKGVDVNPLRVQGLLQCVVRTPWPLSAHG